MPWIVIVFMALLGTPLFIIIGATAIYSYASVPASAMGGGLSLNTFFTEIMDKLGNSSLFIAIPFFAFAGFLLAESKAPKRLVDLSRSVLGKMPGGLGIVAIVTCALFTAFTGASGVTIIALGGLLYPALAREHYPEKFRLGLLTTCGSLGLLFPPSLPLILYALVANNSVDPRWLDLPREAIECKVNDLFLAGIIPGILLIGVLALYTIYVQRKALKQKEEATLPEVNFGEALMAALFELPLPFVILVGIYGGYLTVEQASAVLVVYVLIVEVFIYRDIALRDLPRIVQKTMALVGAILIILCMAIGYSNYLIHEKIPSKILQFMQVYLYEFNLAVLFNIGLLLLWGVTVFFTRSLKVIYSFLTVILIAGNLFLGFYLIPSGASEFLSAHLDKGLAFLIVLNVFLLIVGCMMDIFSAILVVVPIIAPLAYKFGINPYHLGIIFLTNLEIGYSTPPVGINLFISSLRFRKPIITLYAASIPFIILLLIALGFITYIPELSLFLLTTSLPLFEIFQWSGVALGIVAVVVGVVKLLKKPAPAQA